MQDIIFKRLEADCFGPDSIPIYGRAYHYANENGDNPLSDVQGFMNQIYRAIDDAHFFSPKTPAIEVARNFCNLFFVDPMLLEACIGVRLEVLF